VIFNKLKLQKLRIIEIEGKEEYGFKNNNCSDKKYIRRYNQLLGQKFSQWQQTTGYPALQHLLFLKHANRNKKIKYYKSMLEMGELPIMVCGRLCIIIKACFSSEMIINNFISNSELDLKNDFGSHSYVNIENNIDLVN
jgi:hypothetical protein